MTRIFISHSTKDIEFVLTQLKPLFDRLGMLTWCSTTDMRMASDWERQIRSALAQADWFAVVLSPAAVQSPWVQAEAHWALEHRPGRIIPVMVGDCEPSEVHLRLGTLQYIDFRSDPLTAGKRVQEIVRDEASHAVTQVLERPGDDPLQGTMLITKQRSVSLSLHVEPIAGPSYEVQLTIRSWITIGRADDVDLRIPDETVSRRHARITVAPSKEESILMLTDLGSANGTFINRGPLVGGHRLSAGDIVEVGNCRLTVRQIS